MKVLFHIPGPLSAEPSQDQCFLYGYEFAGGTFTGEIFVHSQDNPLYGSGEQWQFCIDNGITLYSSPSVGGDSIGIFDKMYFEHGIQGVMPAGSNTYGGENGHVNIIPLKRNIRTGAGGGTLINQTGNYVEFFDVDAAATMTPIREITQVGDKTYIKGFDGDQNGGLYFVGWGVYIEGVTGFQNNPNGVFKITNFDTPPDLFWNKFKFVHTLGTGSYAGGGVASIHTSSNSGPVIAGKLAYIKDTLNCSWWVARYRMRMTGSLANNYTQINGYGRPDPAAAILYSGEIPPEPLPQIAEVGNIHTVTKYQTLENSKYIKKLLFHLPYVDDAQYYEVYKNNELVKSTNPQATRYEYPYIFVEDPFEQNFKHIGNHYKYRGIGSLGQVTEFSEEISVHNYLYPGMIYDIYDNPDIANLNYLFQDDNDITVCSKDKQNITQSFTTDLLAREFTEKYFKEYYNQLITIADELGKIHIINVANVTGHSIAANTLTFTFDTKELIIQFELNREAIEDSQYFTRVYQAYNHLANPPGKVTHITGPEPVTGIISRAMHNASVNETIIVKAGTYQNESFVLRSDVYLYLEKDAIVRHEGVINGGIFGRGVIEDEKNGTVGRIYGFGTIDVRGAGLFSSLKDDVDIFIQCEKLINWTQDMMIYSSKSYNGNNSRIQIKGLEISCVPANLYTFFDYDNYSDTVFDLDFVNIDTGATALMYGAGDSNSSYIFRNAYINSYTANRGNIEIQNDAKANNLRFIRIKMINQHSLGHNITLLNLSGDTAHSIKLANCLLSSPQESITSNYAINIQMQSKCYAKTNKSALVTITGNSTLEIDPELKVEKV